MMGVQRYQRQKRRGITQSKLSQNERRRVWRSPLERRDGIDRHDDREGFPPRKSCPLHRLQVFHVMHLPQHARVQSLTTASVYISTDDPNGGVRSVAVCHTRSYIAETRVHNTRPTQFRGICLDVPKVLASFLHLLSCYCTVSALVHLRPHSRSSRIHEPHEGQS